jgi:hypothetical protein
MVDEKDESAVALIASAEPFMNRLPDPGVLGDDLAFGIPGEGSAPGPQGLDVFFVEGPSTTVLRQGRTKTFRRPTRSGTWLATRDHTSRTHQRHTVAV